MQIFWPLKKNKSEGALYINFSLGPKWGNVDINALPDHKRKILRYCSLCEGLKRRTRRRCSLCENWACKNHLKDVCHKCLTCS